MLSNYPQHHKSALTALVCASSMLALSACAETAMPNSTPMQLGSAAYAPQGYLKFCSRRPDQCGLPSPIRDDDRATLEKALNEEQWANIFNPQPTAIDAPKTGDALATTADLTGLVDLEGGLTSSEVNAAASVTPISFSFPADAAPEALNQLASADPVTTPTLPFTIAMSPGVLPVVGEPAQQSSMRQASDGPQSLEPSSPTIGLPTDAPKSVEPIFPQTPATGSSTIHMTPLVWSALNGVNQSINAKIRPMSDEQAFGVADYWTLPLSDGPRPVGNCKHYALEKRKALVEAGFSPDALSIAIVKTGWGEVHAVLIVGTDQGDYVLDNLSNWIKGWQEVRYTWIERQVPGKPLHWARVETKPMLIAAAY